MRKKTKPFSGILLEPIERPDARVIRAMAKGDPDKFIALMMATEDYVSEQKADRLVALVAHYQVKSTLPAEAQWLRTLVSLASEFVPGFMYSDEQPRRGRRPTSARLGGIDLLIEVEGLMNKGHSIAGACSIIVKQPGRWKGENRGSLETAYHDEVKRLAKVGQEFRSHPLYSQLREVLKRFDRDQPDDNG